MAEYLLREQLGPDSEWETASAGLSAGWGMPATDAAVDVLREAGVDLSPHRSRPVDRELIDEASVVVVMTAAHRERLQALFPDAREKIFLLKSFSPSGRAGDIEDPMGADEGAYRDIRNEMNAALLGLISFLEKLDL